jgi:glutathione peroxidase
LSQLQERFASRGFTVLAFPSNDFHQEFNDNEEIQAFVKQEFPQVTFPIFGESSLADNPVYQQLRKHLPHAHVKHNFYKYLVNQKGRAVAFHGKKVEPLELVDEIEKLLSGSLDEGNVHHFHDAEKQGDSSVV